MLAARSLLAVALMMMVAACSTAGDSPTTPTTVTIPIATSTTSPITTGSTEPTPVTCDPPFFLPTVLPERVIDDQPDLSAMPLDQFTLQPGTIVTGWTDESGTPVVVFVRGSLPPTRWITTPEPVEVRGIEGAVGDLGKGIWGVAWFEGPDRCDEYYLVLYPPTGPEEAKMVAESLTGGG